jgi:hypothetical protein
MDLEETAKKRAFRVVEGSGSPAWERGTERVKPEEMMKAYEEHRTVEEARDLDAVVATFADECFLENVALGTRAEGREAVHRAMSRCSRRSPTYRPRRRDSPTATTSS